MTNVEPPPGPPRRGFRTGRLEAFSDGVFAIAVTLLVLNIAVPAGASHHLLRAVVDLGPSYLAYVASFSTGLFVPVAAVAGYLAIALYYLTPFRSLSAFPSKRRRPPP